MDTARHEAALQARQEAFAEVSRALAVPSPEQAPYPLYAYDQPIWYSTPHSPRKHPDSPITVDTLRKLADSYDVLRACINHLKREVAAVPIEISPRDPKDKSDRMKGRLDEARALFEIRGPVGGVGSPRRHFESMLIEDISIVGACAIFHQRNRGGGMYESVAIDAATIRPAVDAWGWPQGQCYEQWIYGVKIASFSDADMTYDGIYPVSYTPYFKSPVEYLIQVINSALRADQWNRDWLTDGNTPSDLLALPDSWTPAQVKEYAAFWDAMLTGSKNRQKTKFVPGGTQKVGNPTRKDQDFQALELWLLRRTCAIMGVQPASIGYAGEQYKVSQEGSNDQTSVFGAGVLLDFRKATYDDILQRAGYGDLECQNVTHRQEKAKEQAETNRTRIESGQRTINEVRAEEGLDAVEGGDVVLVAGTLKSLETAINPPAPIAAAGPSKDTAVDPAKDPAVDPAKDPATDTKAPGRLQRDGAKKKTPDIYAVAEQFRSALQSHEDDAVQRVSAAWDVAEKRIREKLDALLARIEEAQSQGQPISDAWLYMEERYRTLLADVAEARAELTDAAAPAITDAQAQAAATAEREAEALANAGAGTKGIGIRWNALPADSVRAFVGFAGDGSPLKDLIDQIGKDIEKDIAGEFFDTMISGIAEGKGPREVARMVDPILQQGRARALNIARTEMHRAARESTRQSCQANADILEGWTWHSAANERTCPACWAMHGTVHPITERLDGHPQCRCVMIPKTRSMAEILGDPSMPDQRPQIPLGTDLFEALDEKTQKAILGPEMHSLYAEGRVKLQDMVSRPDDPRWGTMRTTASITEATKNAEAAGLRTVLVDLARWETKALGRVKVGKAAACRFESDAVSGDVHANISAGLAGCTDAASVRRLFTSIVATLVRHGDC